LLIGEKIITIIPDMGNKSNYLDFYAILKFMFGLNNTINSVFGVFLDKFICVVKRKARSHFFKNFSHDMLLSILDGENKEAYYTEKNNLDRLIGIEIRFEEKIETWFQKERVFGEINIFIKKEKKRIIENEN
jgi:hypothetical protein